MISVAATLVVRRLILRRGNKMINLYLERILPNRNSLRISYPFTTNRVNLQQALDRVTLSANLCETETKSGDVIPSFLGHFTKKNKKVEKPQAGAIQTPVILEPPTQKPDKPLSTTATEIYYQSLVPAYKY